MENSIINSNPTLRDLNFDIHQLNTDKYIETAKNVKLYVKDYGKGKPVILIHGWPLSNEMWEYQIDFLVKNNYRVIAYDRRGFGKSSQPWDGYDYDTLSDDLSEIIEQLELENVTLVGFSMGGGEVIRYFSRHQGKGIAKVALISSIIPFLLKTEDNPEGRPKEKTEATAASIHEDRIGFLDNFGKIFFGVNIINKPLSTPLLEYYRDLCSAASPRATLQCAESLNTTDFRDELHTIKVPTLIIHGTDDKNVPIEVSSEKTAKAIKDNTFIVYEGAPHGLFYTEKDKLNKDLLEFLDS
ncbi:alpha/beta fold hydrolase [Flavobacterium johnsoniae]|uniref:Peptidase family S33 n=1 Tax=Flavobacterium johnsoniae (strain ATCC 17061 / DSM 2064 / JCM 8514 / BCRC 14874 / CCUG 350202 / NBRC 14942 / NCIMB 11054 / UW101) TaxID=376686 RepID=A5FHV0_FLAJ1|nr:alpha/beta hydrolase [Flavobacterium johnsoniae]ABQ05223.1 peptidase family S33 [Flavobacterium johnsoniae UW101]WQG82973.1 alpha/beta hydrolase [Flavobacterium johnsoniae UW101]SHL63217.1 Pimeloyl-ACP methyl ester carboxylesterase [Flavobacterium johnsoniae]